MDLRKLRHAVVLSEELNFARAASKLHLTQPALSRSIQLLEDELRGRLFDRDRRGVRLTAIGRQVVMRARELLQGARSLEHEVKLMLNMEMGDAKLGAGPLPSASLLAPALAALARAHPQVRIEVETAGWKTLLPRLMDGHIEFFMADMRDHGSDRHLSMQPLPPQYGGIFCRPGHPLAGRPLGSPRDVLPYGLASVEQSPDIQKAVARYLGARNFAELPMHLQSSNVALLTSVARQSDVLLVSTIAAVRQELEGGLLIALELPGQPRISPQVHIVTRAGWTLSPTAAWLVERIQAAARTNYDVKFPRASRTVKKRSSRPH